ncbi:MAG TPA: heat-shock protein Hsp20 [Prolixibacteraceae bacterium]|nr:heat-shock protein Hsp20 [Prolixibacteraceae bacterium]
MNLVRFHNGGLNRYLVDQLFRSMETNDSRQESCGCVPSNVLENEKDYRLELSVPGFSKEEVKISVHKNMLTIKSEKNLEESENAKYLRRGFAPQNFEKNFQLSKDIDGDKISAHFNNGILEVILPKKEEVLEKATLEIAIQ